MIYCLAHVRDGRRRIVNQLRKRVSQPFQVCYEGNPARSWIRLSDADDESVFFGIEEIEDVIESAINQATYKEREWRIHHPRRKA